jgi:feruloyl-CoA synthase
MSAAAPRYRDVALGGSLSAHFTQRDDGSTVVRSTEALGPYPERITDRFLHWAAVAPDRTLVAKRHQGGDWRKVSYAEALQSARSIAQGLMNLGLSAERPIVILSDNDIEHLLLALGALLAGVPFAPISPAYSVVSQDYGKLRHIFGLLTPGLVFASSGSAYGKAITATVPAETPVVLTEGGIDGRTTMSFESLRQTVPTAAVEQAHAQIGPDTIAKFLFTSGSTKLPKGVINTQRMICSNQQMILQCFPHLAEEPPVLVDWLPWNHTFGGNHNIGITLYNGGTLYIDEGKPTAALIGETLRNLREIAPTLYFNVPKGFEEIANALEVDAQLRKTLLSKVKMFFFSGAGLSQPVWDKLERVAEDHCGERIKMLTGLGMTETAPFAICANAYQVKSGHIGLPAPGVELKLVPEGDKVEVRYRGPNVTPGYWRAPGQTAESFDDEGYYRSGDAVKPMDPAQPSAASRSTAAPPRTSSCRPAPSSRSARCAPRSSRPATRACRTSSSPASTATTSACCCFRASTAAAPSPASATTRRSAMCSLRRRCASSSSTSSTACGRPVPAARPGSRARWCWNSRRRSTSAK